MRVDPNEKVQCLDFFFLSFSDFVLVQLLACSLCTGFAAGHRVAAICCAQSVSDHKPADLCTEFIFTAGSCSQWEKTRVRQLH